MLKEIYDPSNSIDNFRTGINGKGLTDGFTADGQTGNKRRHDKQHDSRPSERKILQNLRRNGSRCGAGDDTADITNNIIANRADTFGIVQKRDRLSGTGHFTGSHGIERLFIRGSDSDANDIKDNAYQNDGKQNHKGDCNPADSHDLFRNKGDRTGNKDRYQKNGDHPANGLIAFLFL